MEDPTQRAIDYFVYHHIFLSYLVIAYFPLNRILDAIKNSQESQLILTLQKVVDLHTHGSDDLGKRMLKLFIWELSRVRDWKRSQSTIPAEEIHRNTDQDMINLLMLLLRRYLDMPSGFKNKFSFLDLRRAFVAENVQAEIDKIKQYIVSQQRVNADETQQLNDLIQILTWLMSQYEYAALNSTIEIMVEYMPSTDKERLIETIKKQAEAVEDQAAIEKQEAVAKRKWKITRIPPNKLRVIIDNVIADLGHRFEIDGLRGMTVDQSRETVTNILIELGYVGI
jgi:hypothetical protein